MSTPQPCTTPAQIQAAGRDAVAALLTAGQPQAPMDRNAALLAAAAADQARKGAA